jgi:hypothetical protein
MTGIRKTEIVTLGQGRTPLLGCPDWAIESIDPKLYKGHGDNRYFKISVKDNVITYTPVLFWAAVFGCNHQGVGES